MNAFLLFYAVASILLVIGLFHEDQLVRFEDKLHRKIKNALRCYQHHKANKNKSIYNHHSKPRKCQAYDQFKTPWADAVKYFNNQEVQNVHK